MMRLSQEGFYFVTALLFVILIFLEGEECFRQRFAQGSTYSNETALSLRSRRSGTKFAAPSGTAY